MGLATFSFMNVAFALAVKDMRHSAFSMETLTDRNLMIGTGVGLLVTVLASELGVLQRLLGTVPLTFEQWAICIVVGLAVLVASEIRKRVWPGPLDDEVAAET
jgi:Ca2+-transporting ATPase